MRDKEQKVNLQLKADMAGHYLINKECEASKQIGIFYAPSGGSVHKVARMIKQT